MVTEVVVEEKAGAQDSPRFVVDIASLIKLVSELRHNGVRTFEHPSGLKISFAHSPGPVARDWP